ncbi:MAG: MBL fold metallo-hydrolase [Thermoplasmatota archaeon]
MRGKGTKIVLLGTGTPNAEPDRSGPSTALIVNGKTYIIDFGPGIVRRASEAYRSGIEALKPSDLETAFVTHLHSDHTAGYPDLILTPWVLGRKNALRVFGPPGIRSMTDHILKAYREDIDIRINDLEGANDDGWRADVNEIGEGGIYQDENIRAVAFLVNHGGWSSAFGYRFETEDGTVVISGDTAPFPEMDMHYRGCDVLIHEVYSGKGFDKRPEKWKKYHAAYHTSAMELGEIASRVRPKLLVLYHQLLWGTTPDELVDEIRSAYDGKVAYGRDLDSF